MYIGGGGPARERGRAGALPRIIIIISSSIRINISISISVSGSVSVSIITALLVLVGALPRAAARRCAAAKRGDLSNMCRLVYNITYHTI